MEVSALDIGLPPAVRMLRRHPSPHHSLLFRLRTSRRLNDFQMEALPTIPESRTHAVADTGEAGLLIELPRTEDGHSRLDRIHHRPSAQVIAVFLVIAIGLDQSPGTARWRLLLMSEKEEMAWSHKR